MTSTWGTQKLLFLLCLGFLLFAGLLLAAGEGEAQIIVDDDNGTWADYGTIQEAIDATASNASTGQKRIRVYEGEYYENVEIDNNVWIKGNGTGEVLLEGSGSDYCVDVVHDEVTLKGMTIRGNGSGVASHGIYANGYDDLEVVDCVITGSSDGVHFYNGNRLKLYETYIHNNSWHGVVVFQVLRTRVRDCVIENNSRIGFHIYNSRVVNITNTEFHYDGPFITGSPSAYSTTHWFGGTSVNGDPIYYLTNASGQSVPTGYGQVIIANCEDIEVDIQEIDNADCAVSVHDSSWVNITNGTFRTLYWGIFIQSSDNCTLSDSYIDGGSGDNCVYLYVTKWMTVRDCRMRNSLKGIYIYFRCEDTLIERCRFTKHSVTGIDAYFDNERTSIKDCNVQWNTNDGIQLRDCISTEIHNVTVNNSWSDGIFIRQGTQYTNITNCTVRQNGAKGIYLFSQVTDGIISGCNIDDNFNHGIYGSVSVAGYKVVNNSIHDHNAQGIYLYDTDNSTIAWNEIFDNDGYGVDLSSCSDVTVHHNNFANNGGSGSQGQDTSTWNTWDDDVSEGNYWSDWNGTGTYPIDGSTGAEDRYPLGDMTNTSAPEKVPEFALLIVTTSALAIFAVFRRRT